MRNHFIPKLKKNIIFAALLAAASLTLQGCVDGDAAILTAAASKVSAYIRDYSKMTEEQRAGDFKKYAAELGALRQGAGEFLMKDAIVYVSPEQENAFYADHTSFMWSVGALVVAKSPSTYQADSDPFLSAIKEYAQFIAPNFKDMNGPFVDERTEILKKRLGTMYDKLDPIQLRDIIWDDKRFQAVITDDQTAYTEVHTGWLTGYDASGLNVSLDTADETLLQNWFNGLTVPGGQPPS